MNNGKGHTVMKFNQDGKLLMTLGKPGEAGTGPDTFNDRPTSSSHRTATSLSPTAMAARITTASSSSPRTESSSRSGARRALGLASSMCRTISRWILPGGCSSATAATIASRCSTRTAISFWSGGSSAGRAASSSTRTICSMSPTIRRTSQSAVPLGHPGRQRP